MQSGKIQRLSGNPIKIKVLEDRTNILKVSRNRYWTHPYNPDALETSSQSIERYRNRRSHLYIAERIQFNMRPIWDTLIDCKEQPKKEFDPRGKEIQEEGMAQFNQSDNGWINRVWQTEDCRRCHIDVVDARESKGLWMMHVCISQFRQQWFIYGFDVAGKKQND